MAKDFYETLGLEKDAGPEEIKQAFRKLAFRYHPDRNQNDPASAEKMKEINEAYATLSHPAKKQEYDTLRARYGPEAYAHYTQTHSPEDTVRDSDIDAIFEEFARNFGYRSSADIFKEYYGPGFRSFEFHGPGMSGRGFVFTGSFGGARTSRVKEAPPQQALAPAAPSLGILGGLLKFFFRLIGVEFPERGKDWSDSIVLKPEQAGTGGEMEYRYQKWGKPKNLMVKIPPGISSGQQIKLKGMGGPGKGGGEPGDLYLRVKIRYTILQKIRNIFGKAPVR